MATEFELKYCCTPEDQARIQAAFPGEWTETPMATTYFDTPDGQLSLRRWTLRHRREGDRDICTLKTPGRDNVRGEWETECADLPAALPTLEADSGCALPRQLVPVCGARFTRLTQLLELEGCTAELALDCGVLTAGAREMALCECELELKAGAAEALTAFAADFQEKFVLTPEPKSKFARAKALAQEA